MTSAVHVPVGRVRRSISPPGTSTRSAPASTAWRPAVPHRRRRAADAGDQGQGRPVPPRPVKAGLGYEVADHGTNQWNGAARDPVAGRPGRRAGRLRRRPRLGEPLVAEARSIGATCNGIRLSGRSTSPTAERSTIRTWSTSSTGWRGCASRPPRGQPTAPRWHCAAIGTSLRRTTTCGRWSTTSTRATSPPASAPPSTASWMPGSSTSCARPPGAGVYTYWTTSGSPSRSAAACASTSCSAPLPFAARVAAPAIDREERKGAGASDHAPVVVQLKGQG